MYTDSPPQYRSQTYLLPSTHNPTRSLSKNAGLSVSYANYQTPSQTTSTTNLKLHTNSSNPDTPLVSTSNNPQIPLLLQWHLKFQFSLFYSTAEEGHCDWPKVYHFHFVSSLYVLVMLTRGPDDAFVCLGKCHSVTPFIFVCNLYFRDTINRK